MVLTHKTEEHSNGKVNNSHQATMSDDKPKTPVTTAAASMSTLTPSQALKKPNKASAGKTDGNKDSNGNSNADNNAGNNRNKNRNNRRRRNAKNPNNKNNASTPPTDGKVNDSNAPNAPFESETAKGNGNKNNQNSNNSRRQKQRQRQRQRGNKKNGDATNTTASNQNGDETGESGTKGDGVNTNTGNPQPPTAAKRKNNKKRKPKKKYPWRRHIPEGTVDPITLDNLNTLEYPPFALCADEPYIPVPEWPVPEEATTAASQSKHNNNDNAGNDNGAIDATPRQPPPAEDVEDLNRQRLADQWGEFMLPSKESQTATAASTGNAKHSKASAAPTPPLSQRPLNLFDGRALAFYMVSQLQFIDPFTRRDLTRAELQNLDRYLDRYGSAGMTGFDNSTNNNTKQNNRNTKKKKQQQKLKVTDAYDAKGITLSSAGAAAATAQGRADIMQQTAQQLLNSLFVGQPSVSSITPSEPDRASERQSRRQQAESFSLHEQYTALQRQEREAAAAGERRYHQGFGNANAGFPPSSYDDDGGGYGGFMIIDDDENPELRGRSHNDFPSLGAAAAAATSTPLANESSPFYSASHIAGQYGNTRPATGPGAFPALPPRPATEPSSAATNTTNASAVDGGKPAASKSKKSKTLSKISGIVKKTTAEEKQKQWEAREAARRKAMLSNLTYGMNPVTADPSRSLLVPPSMAGHASTSGSATEEQMQRNKAFAEALGVKPATQRHYASGWARPTTTEGAGSGIHHEHLNELEAVLYPDGLIVSAREHRMDFLLKLEKRWKRFLNDDKAASLPLNKMDRSTRKFVHAYAEFWNLKTESFDPEPNRYVHCVKLPDTRMPQPLLSDVARHWRGPSALPLPDATRTIASVIGLNDHTSQQTAGQTPLQVRDAPAPLKLRAATAMSSSKGDLVALGEAAVQNSRSDGLMDKQRPQLKLLPRSVPLELPPYEEQLEQQAAAAAALDSAEDLRRRQVRLEERRRKEREMEQKKKQALEDAFASDDESDRKRAGSSDSDSEWEDNQEALFTGSDEE